MIGQRLEVRQGQGLVITPQLQQAIKLLQLSNQELDEYVEAELEKNPLLQREEPEPGVEIAREAPTDSTELSFSDAGTSDRSSTVDAREDDVYGDATPGERTSDRLSDEAAEQPGLSDWSAAGKGGSFNDGDGGEKP